MSVSRQLNRFQESGIYLGPTRGKSSPKNNRRGCLCIDSNKYSRECCDGALMQQGIGQIAYPYPQRGAFSNGFSNGFDID